VDPAAAGALLERIALRQADFGGGYTISLIEEGDQVVGNATLDNCGFDFTTEAYRIARRQYVIDDSAGNDAGMSNEVVAYDTAAHAQEALAQWEKAADTCPSTPVRSSVAGMPAVTVSVKKNVKDDPALPVARNSVLIEKQDAGKKGVNYLGVALQVDGNVLDAVYINQHRPVSADDLAALKKVASRTGERLASVEGSNS
jgi:hypothetical protein